jgi:segregation and condensation protein B
MPAPPDTGEPADDDLRFADGQDAPTGEEGSADEAGDDFAPDAEVETSESPECLATPDRNSGIVEDAGEADTTDASTDTPPPETHAREPGPDEAAGHPDPEEPAEAPPDPALFAQSLRIAEALVFASDRPVTPSRLQTALPPGCEARAVLAALAAECAGRPAQLVEVAGGFAFRTAPELAPAITRVVEAPRRLPRAAMETLAIVAYHQPVTRAEIEEIRGASLSQSTLELLLDAALIAPRGRKEVPGRPSLWGTTPRFLEQFGLKALGDLPRREELVNEPTLPLEGPPPAAPEQQQQPEEAAAPLPVA